MSACILYTVDGCTIRCFGFLYNQNVMNHPSKISTHLKKIEWIAQWVTSGQVSKLGASKDRVCPPLFIKDFYSPPSLALRHSVLTTEAPHVCLPVLLFSSDFFPCLLPLDISAQSRCPWQGVMAQPLFCLLSNWLSRLCSDVRMYNLCLVKFVGFMMNVTARWADHIFLNDCFIYSHLPQSCPVEVLISLYGMFNAHHGDNLTIYQYYVLQEVNNYESTHVAI